MNIRPNDPNVSATLTRRRLLLGSLGLLMAFSGCNHNHAPDQKTVDLFIESDGDFLGFRPDTLTCRTGSRVHLTFHHAGRFLSALHNWVLVFPGQMEAVDKDAEATDGVLAAGDSRVIAAVRMCEKGETATTEFVAPAPGDYPFFCSTPGHAEMMNGILHVTT